MTQLIYAGCLFSVSMVNQICALSYMTEISADEKDRAKNFGKLMFYIFRATFLFYLLCNVFQHHFYYFCGS